MQISFPFLDVEHVIAPLAEFFAPTSFRAIPESPASSNRVIHDTLSTARLVLPHITGITIAFPFLVPSHLGKDEATEF